MSLNVGTAVGVAIFSALYSAAATPRVAAFLTSALLFGAAAVVGRATYTHPREELP